MRRDLRAITFTWLLVGAMDITSACILAGARGATPIRVLQFIASGLIGRSAFNGGIFAATLGLALHFTIALGVVLVFYVAKRRLPLLRERPVICGIVYGILVFAVMNLIVVPLSAARPRHALVPDLIQLAIHMFIIGLATSLLLRRFSGASAR